MIRCAEARKAATTGRRTSEVFYMSMPLEDLFEFDGNAYEFTVAVNRRSYQLAVLKTPEVEKNNGKVVSLSMRQVFSKQIEYRFE
jgi:DNA-directed RNA polymerase subunit omega